MILSASLLAIDRVAAAGLSELFNDFRIATAIAHRATAASFYRFYGMYEFERCFWLLAKETMVGTTL